VNAGIRVEHLFRRLEPVDLARGLGPEPLRVALPAGIDVVIAARTGVHLGLLLAHSVTLRWRPTGRPRRATGNKSGAVILRGSLCSRLRMTDQVAILERLACANKAGEGTVQRVGRAAPHPHMSPCDLYHRPPVLSSRGPGRDRARAV